ncbi:endonuclease/exonuclease/phosphatase family protein [Pokkaliibacter sp. MBI-7]|uniref:endonuclease/exonuclease/phosphatase family protein n=1 Tax=Pokkaliibacter sp. MBI-7 TaxID=3040600 RepID=UPI0024498A30|nr:endonuclease/exonuclease/phosphatase family protein [Pokkaliibacter sp. MBI-7]MDH2435238.1 endonuclease/exonuclease/phosphatase family protein [Pokkaliibacter sp. MBI-7]
MMAFSVMTWNVENFFLVDAGDDAAATEDARRFEQKLGLLTATIRELAPDVVAFQELGKDALALLQQTLGANLYPSMHEGQPDRRGIRVGVLSKLPFVQPAKDLSQFTGPVPVDQVKVLEYSGALATTSQLGRGAVRVSVAVGPLQVHLITCHLKSKLLTFPHGRFSTHDEVLRAQVAAMALFRRAAEAVEVRMETTRLLTDHPQDGVIVLGDMNDGEEAATSQLLLGPPGSQMNTGGFQRPDQGDAQRLFNTALLIPPAQRFSRIEHGQPEMLDQILCSQHLLPADQHGKRQLPEVKSYTELVNGLASVSADPKLRHKSIVPDHAPVVARFAL